MLEPSRPVHAEVTVARALYFSWAPGSPALLVREDNSHRAYFLQPDGTYQGRLLHDMMADGMAPRWFRNCHVCPQEPPSNDVLDER